MITPIKWFAGNKKLDSMRKMMLSNNHIRELHIIDANKTFNIIMNRVAYFIYDKSFIGKTVIIDETNSDNNDFRYISDNNIDCFILSKLDASIVKKVLSYYKNKEKIAWIEKYIQSQNFFGIASSTRGFEVTQCKDDLILHYTGYQAQGDNTSFIPKDWVGKNLQYINTYKVIYPHGCGSKSNVLTRVLCIGPNEVCTHSYMVIGPINDKIGAENIAKYIKTKFTRMLVRVRMVDQNMDRDRFRFVPLQDFISNSDIDWTKSIGDIDKQLYKKYNLTQEEIDYIESTIKPME